MIEKMVNAGSGGGAGSDESDNSPKFFDVYNRLCQLRRPASSLLDLQEEKCVLFYSAPDADLLSPYKLEFHTYRQDSIKISILHTLSYTVILINVYETNQDPDMKKGF